MELVKHLGIFDPRRIGSVGIIGVGAVGSQIAMQIAKLGVENIVLMDHDCVEAHNVPNQLYSIKDVGQSKVSACATHLWDFTDARAVRTLHRRANAKSLSAFAELLIVKRPSSVTSYVFVCVDSMESRKEIFRGLRHTNAHAIFETRMNSSSGAVYALDPQDLLQAEEYEGVLYPDSDVQTERQACGTIPSIISTACVNASLAVDLFIRWSMNVLQNDAPNEIIFDLKTGILTHRVFPRSV